LTKGNLKNFLASNLINIYFVILEMKYSDGFRDTRHTLQDQFELIQVKF